MPTTLTVMPGADSSGGSSKPTSPVLEEKSSAPTLATAWPVGGGSATAWPVGDHLVAPTNDISSIILLRCTRY